MVVRWSSTGAWRRTSGPGSRSWPQRLLGRGSAATRKISLLCCVADQTVRLTADIDEVIPSCPP
jgi:hypothetical protein